MCEYAKGIHEDAKRILGKDMEERDLVVTKVALGQVVPWGNLGRPICRGGAGLRGKGNEDNAGEDG